MRDLGPARRRASRTNRPGDPRPRPISPSPPAPSACELQIRTRSSTCPPAVLETCSRPVTPRELFQALSPLPLLLRHQIYADVNVSLPVHRHSRHTDILPSQTNYHRYHATEPDRTRQIGGIILRSEAFPSPMGQCFTFLHRSHPCPEPKTKTRTSSKKSVKRAVKRELPGFPTPARPRSY